MFTYDTSLFPFVHSRIVGALTDEDLRVMTTMVDEFITRGGRYVTMSDGRGAVAPDIVMRRRISEVTKSLNERTRDRHVAGCVIVGSRLLVGALTAIRWVVPSPSPERFTSSAAESVKYLRDAAATADLSLPPGVDDVAARLDAEASRKAP